MARQEPELYWTKPGHCRVANMLSFSIFVLPAISTSSVKRYRASVLLALPSTRNPNTGDTKMKVKIVLAALLAVVISLPVASAQPRFQPGDKTIAEIAVSSPDSFSTLVAALVCTDLVAAVSDPSAELTVFAPTNDAFAKLGLNAGNICGAFDSDTLSTVLLYHVVGDRRPSPSVIRGKNKSITMLDGGNIYPKGKRSLEIKDNVDRTVSIEMPDVMASNGIIHVIDGVLLPFLP